MKRLVFAALALAALPLPQTHADAYRLPGGLPRDPFTPHGMPRDLTPRLLLPDLVVTRAHATEYRHNRQWKVDYCVKNVGTAATGREYWIRFANTYVGDGPVVGGFAGMTGSMHHSSPLPGLAPGIERCSSINFYIPRFAGAADFFTAASNARVIVDYNNLIGEINESNNAKPVTFTSVF
jgi:hypothetical protein